MKLYEIPVNTLVELQFDYLQEKHMVSSGLLYRYSDTVYVSAVKSAGVTIEAKKLKEFSLIYKSDAAVYSFRDLKPRLVSYCGQKLYAIQTEQEASLDQRSEYRLFVGSPVTAKITSNGKTKQIECILKDISMTGMGIVSNIKLEEYAKIEITFQISNHSQETLVASIIYSREFRSGSAYLYGCELDVPNDTIGNYVARQRAKIAKEEE
jgi:PilZ domain.